MTELRKLIIKKKWREPYYRAYQHESDISLRLCADGYNVYRGDEVYDLSVFARIRRKNVESLRRG